MTTHTKHLRRSSRSDLVASVALVGLSLLVWMFWAARSAPDGESLRSGEWTLDVGGERAAVFSNPPTRLPVAGSAPIAFPARTEARASTLAREPRDDERNEATCFAWFEHLAATNPDELERRAVALFAGEGPDFERVALLRALHETSSPRRAVWFARAIRQPGAETPPERVSVSSFAVRYLADRAELDPGARRILREAIWSGDRAMPAELRRRAAGALAAVVRGVERAELEEALETETDPLVIESARAALDASFP